MSSSTKLSPVTTGFLFAIASAALFAVRPIIVKLIYAQDVDTTTLIALRMLFSVPFYLVLLIYFLRDAERRSRLDAKKTLQIIGIGMLGYYVASYLDLVGLKTVTAQLGRMILYTFPTFVVLFGALFFAKPITKRVILSLIITYTGISVIFGHDLNYFGSDIIVGGLFLTASAITFACYLLFAKPIIDDVGSRLFTCIALIGASIGILTHFSITHSIHDAIEITRPAFYYCVFLALFCTVIPTFFTSAAVARIGADKTGIVAMTGPIFTSIAAVNIIGEAFTIYHFLGIIFIIAGVAILNDKKQASNSNV